jgi:hypothetical protein
MARGNKAWLAVGSMVAAGGLSVVIAVASITARAQPPTTFWNPWAYVGIGLILIGILGILVGFRNSSESGSIGGGSVTLSQTSGARSKNLQSGRDLIVNGEIGRGARSAQTEFPEAEPDDVR